MRFRLSILRDAQRKGITDKITLPAWPVIPNVVEDLFTARMLSDSADDELTLLEGGA